jgi:glycosyltransferase involved in cell wall biosynthesis
MPKVILFSQFPLPYHQVGSWSTLYKNYLTQEGHKIDHVICEKPQQPFEKVSYSFVQKSWIDKLQQKRLKNPYIGYINALESTLKRGEKYVIQLVDNFGIVPHIQAFLTKNKLRQDCYLQFFYHGFAPFYGNFQSRTFYETIDEMVLLTNDSYKAHRDYYTVLPCRFSVMHNGIDTQKFFPLSQSEKAALKEQMGVTGKTVFVWCSQDRPKKGLDFILAVWKKIVEDRNDIELWVIGANREFLVPHVKFFGKIPNDELPAFYQASDCYLFPTLCHEGFGMSLIEAMHCGCYSIASALGGVPEVLAYGKYGKLIENPHFEEAWREAILHYLTQNPQTEGLPRSLYSRESWNNQIDFLIENAKKTV